MPIDRAIGRRITDVQHFLGIAMNRIFRPNDAALDKLNGDRDHIAIQLNLAGHAQESDGGRIEALRHRLQALEQQIARHRPADG